jgi:hypothetical protein
MMVTKLVKKAKQVAHDFVARFVKIPNDDLGVPSTPSTGPDVVTRETGEKPAQAPTKEKPSGVADSPHRFKSSSGEKAQESKPHPFARKRDTIASANAMTALLYEYHLLQTRYVHHMIEDRVNILHDTFYAGSVHIHVDVRRGPIQRRWSGHSLLQTISPAEQFQVHST